MIVIEVGHDYRITPGHIVLDHVRAEFDWPRGLIRGSEEETTQAEGGNSEIMHVKIIPQAGMPLTAARPLQGAVREIAC
jgi:hypothetical protein